MPTMARSVCRRARPTTGSSILSDVLPTAWQAVRYAGAPGIDSLAVIGLGPIGDMCCRIAQHVGVETVIGIDLVDDRLERCRRRGVTVLDGREYDGEAGLTEVVRDFTGGRGPAGVIDAVGMEAHGVPFAAAADKAIALLPRALSAKLMLSAGSDRLTGSGWRSRWSVGAGHCRSSVSTAE